MNYVTAVVISSAIQTINYTGVDELVVELCNLLGVELDYNEEDNAMIPGEIDISSIDVTSSTVAKIMELLADPYYENAVAIPPQSMIAEIMENMEVII